MAWLFHAWIKIKIQWLKISLQYFIYEKAECNYQYKLRVLFLWLIIRKISTIFIIRKILCFHALLKRNTFPNMEFISTWQVAVKVNFLSQKNLKINSNVERLHVWMWTFIFSVEVRSEKKIVISFTRFHPCLVIVGHLLTFHKTTCLYVNICVIMQIFCR